MAIGKESRKGNATMWAGRMERDLSPDEDARVAGEVMGAACAGRGVPAEGEMRKIVEDAVRVADPHMAGPEDGFGD